MRFIRGLASVFVLIVGTNSFGGSYSVAETHGVAQQSAPAADETPHMISNTRAVVLDVVVTDRAGNPVRGLTKDDFVVREDGQRQAIAAFETSGPEAPADQKENSGESRAQTILLLDELNIKGDTPFQDFAYAQEAVTNVLKRSDRVDQPVTLLALTAQGIVVIHDATRDGTAILSAFQTHLRIARLPLPDSVLATQNTVNASLGAMEQLAAATAFSGVHTTLIWITTGLDSSSLRSLSLHWQEQLRDSVRGLSFSLLRSRMTIYTLDPRGVGDGQVTPTVPIYATATGKNPNADAFAESLASGGNFPDLSVAQGTFRMLAEGTGGKAIHGRNDLDVVIEKFMDDGSSAYTLTYYPSNRNFNKQFRKINVVVERPGLEANTRPGYFALPEPSSPPPAEARYELVHALTSELPYNGIHVKLSAADRPQSAMLPETPVAKKTPAATNAATNAATQAVVSVSVDPHGLSWNAADGANPINDAQPKAERKSNVEVMAVAYRSNGKPLDVVTRAMVANIAIDQFDAALDRGWNFPMKLSVAPDVVRIRLVIRDIESGRMGSADLPLPNGLRTLSASGVTQQ